MASVASQVLSVRTDHCKPVLVVMVVEMEVVVLVVQVVLEV